MCDRLSVSVAICFLISIQSHTHKHTHTHTHTHTQTHTQIHTHTGGGAEERREAVSEPASASESHWPPAGDSSVDGGETGGEVHGFVDAVMNSCVHIIFSCVDGVIYVCACVRACACVPV